MKGLNWLKEYDVPFNTMTVIGRHNQNAGAEVYRALRDMGSENMQFIPLVERFDPQQHLSAPPDQGSRNIIRSRSGVSRKGVWPLYE
ncbi:hypothetical protein [Aliamphritea spongicola]|nr:hypothetical protein [Aliamphritea spongicola]